jgi:hypothetical protein
MATTYKNAQISASAGGVSNYVTLYKTPTSLTSSVISSIVVCNTASTSATYRIGIMTTEGSPSGANWQVYDATIAGNDTVALTLGISLPASASDNNIIRVSASAATVVFSAYVSEIT